MATETFNAEQLILSIEGSVDVFREDVAATVAGLAHLTPQDAEDLVATAGEDERAYGVRDRATFLDAFYRLADEFLRDDDGGYHHMVVHITRYYRNDAALELWFHVGRPGSETGGVWIRHMVVGLNDTSVYADIGK